ncbi:MAG: biopolymer transporter ExbD [Acidobacteria bacterium]|nr:biopolymer transporter ExbD [Acidobacteriota bacterium]
MIRSTRRGRSGADEQLLASINVTPFVDVVLVLLIIFMITAAVVEFGLQVSVPKTTISTARPKKDFLTLQIGSDGRLILDGAAVSLYDIADAAKKADSAEPKVYVRVHKSAPWEIVAQVLAECRAGGVEVNLIPKPLTRDPRG